MKDNSDSCLERQESINLKMWLESYGIFSTHCFSGNSYNNREICGLTSMIHILLIFYLSKVESYTRLKDFGRTFYEHLDRGHLRSGVKVIADGRELLLQKTCLFRAGRIWKIYFTYQIKSKSSYFWQLVTYLVYWNSKIICDLFN